MSAVDLTCFSQAFSHVRFAKAVEVFSPGAWRRSEVGVARSAAARAPDHTPESGSQSPTVGETDMGITQERKVTHF